MTKPMSTNVKDKRVKLRTRAPRSERYDVRVLQQCVDDKVCKVIFFIRQYTRELCVT